MEKSQKKQTASRQGQGEPVMSTSKDQPLADLPGGSLPEAAQTQSLVSGLVAEIGDADRSLLGGYRGGAILVREDASVIAANDAAAALEALLQHDAVPEISNLIADVATSGMVAGGTVSLPGAQGDIFLDVDVLPREGTDTILILCRDITMERNLRSALVESRQRYKDLVEVSSDFAWEVGPEGEFVFVSPGGALGFSADELVNHQPSEFVINADKYDPLPFYSRESKDEVEIWMRKTDNSLACLMISCLPLYKKDGKWRGARGVCRDVTIEREREATLTQSRHREQLLNYIVSTIRDEVEPDKMLAAAAAAAARAQGAAGCRVFRLLTDGTFEVAAEYGDNAICETMNDLMGRLKSDGDVVELEVGEWQVLLAGTQYNQPLNGAICLWKAGKDGGWDDDDVRLLGDVASQIGITIEQVHHHEHILKLSRTDGLTGLLNRRAFYEEELPRHIRDLHRDNGTGALFYLDMDNFKRVNDVHGHHRGDEAILFLCGMLLENSRSRDVVSRLGGDEFALWLGQVDRNVAEVRAQELLNASQAMRKFSGDDDHPLGLSIGVAFYDAKTNESLDDFIGRADEAMYAVKKAGKGGYQFAKPPGGGTNDPASKQEEPK